MEKKLQKPYPTDYILSVVPDLWQGHYQILLILLKELIKLNMNTNTMIKYVKFAKLNTKTGTTFFNTQTLKVI